MSSHSNPVENLRNTAATHRSFMALARCDEARIYYEQWASWYERWAEAEEQRRPDYSAITQTIAHMSL